MQDSEARDNTQTIAFTVNGQPVSVDVAATTTLLQMLREYLDLRGVRSGCTLGACGACSVLLDGASVRSCDLPASGAVGRSVVTPEGLGTPDDPHPVQQAFFAAQAAQCGYCINGMIMTVAAQTMAGETRGVEPRELLADHLCRCGTHGRILSATEAALGLPPRGWAMDGGVAATSDGSVTLRDPATGREDGLPAALAADPRVECWVELSNGRLRVLAGKVELGQGIRTAFTQIVAAGVGLPMAMIDVVPTRTDRSPDQWYTAGSESIEAGGTALAMAASAFRRLLLHRAAGLLGCEENAVTLAPDGVHGPDTARLPWDEVERHGPITGVVDVTDLPDWSATPVGEPVPRDDLRIKLTGAPAFLHDITLPDMLFARPLLPSAPDRWIEAFDDRAVRELPGVIDVVRDGRVIIVIADRDEHAARAVERLARDVHWSAPTATARLDQKELLRSAPTEILRLRDDDDVEARLGTGRRLTATYFKPYQAHGSVAPSAAIARVNGEDVTLWCHSQGVFPLRRELSALFGLEEHRLRIEYVDGPGCYGQNGADDAAAFAIVAARAVPGRPVRLQFSVADEFGWEPYGSAMLVDLTASVSDDGRIDAWRHRAVTDAHISRPNGEGNRLAVRWLRDGEPRPAGRPHEAGARNGVPLYDIPSLDVSAEHISDGPIRTGALRTLGSYTNVFAAESFIDELAHAVGCDPVEFRLRHLTDARARRVLEVVADRAGWQPHRGPSGNGRGVALARYKGSRAYVAVIADITVDDQAGHLRVDRVVAACDAGTVINPDGLRNQVEGGILQGISRALFEASTVGPEGVRERDWLTYRTLRFPDVPTMEVVLVASDAPPLGVGESSSPPVPAALANAIDDAVGVRLRDLPLSVEQIRRRMLDMDADDAARVLF